MTGNNYFLKIIILFGATLAGIFAIWYALVREESADWIVGQVVHQVSPYAVTESGGGAIITNVVAGYTFTLPPGFKTAGARNLVLYLESAGGKKCEIKHYLKPENAKADAERLAFKLVAENEKNDCEKYLEKIKRSVRDATDL